MKDFEVVLNGGLGNQLFGWATALGISKKTGLSFELNASNTRPRGYQLLEYGIEASFAKPRYSNLPQTRLLRQLTKVAERFGVNSKFNYSENGFRFDSRFFDNPRRKTLYGYFQSPLYFEHVRSDIVKTLNNFQSSGGSYLDLLKILTSESFMSVHIRRGDYIGLENYHGLVSSNYFERARNLALVFNPKMKFVVFSDSISLAKADFPNADLYIGEDVDLTPPQLLSLMSATQGIIGSNSSLSWWAGYLLKGENPFRVYPEPWFSNKDLDTRDLVPPDWMRLPSGY
jgi:hypothetical protein